MGSAGPVLLHSEEHQLRAMEVATPHRAKAVLGQAVLQQYLVVAMSMMHLELR